MWSIPAWAFNDFALSSWISLLLTPTTLTPASRTTRAHRAADPAADIDHRHALAQLQLGDHQPLMPYFGVLQALPGRQRREMEGLAPTEHHELAAKVVVFPDGFGVVVARRAVICRRRRLRSRHFRRQAAGARSRPVHPSIQVSHATLGVRPAVRGIQILG